VVNEVRQQGPLFGYRILEIGDLRTALGCRQLADLGAEVIRIEPPGGAPDRHLAPFAGDQPGPERSLAYLARNAGKRSVVLDLAKTPTARTFCNSWYPRTPSSPRRRPAKWKTSDWAGATSGQ
jgi:crotonobetainyl-CoA:carnitine CoA-transferase CaiB-like acyl-CoA transferase